MLLGATMESSSAVGNNSEIKEEDEKEVYEGPLTSDGTRIFTLDSNLEIKEEDAKEEFEDPLTSDDEQKSTVFQNVAINEEVVKKEEEQSSDSESSDSVSSIKCEYDSPVKTSPPINNKIEGSEDRQQITDRSRRSDLEEPGPKKIKVSFRKISKYLYCDACSYKTDNPQGMEYHLRKHTGEKPHACDYCNYKASHPTTLARHVWSKHTGEKPYACKICDFKAAQPGSLNRHMKTHTGEKPFKCEWCDFRSADLATIRFHESSHTGDKPIACYICDFSCTRLRGLRRHMSRDHPREPLMVIQSVPTSHSMKNYRRNEASNTKKFAEQTRYYGSSMDDSDEEQNIDSWVAATASSSGRRIKPPQKLDL